MTPRSTVQPLAADLAGDRCPMVDFVNLISGKWAIPIPYRLILIGTPVRFSELQRAVAPITQKELTKQLRLFETRGLVRRKVYRTLACRAFLIAGRKPNSLISSSRPLYRVAAGSGRLPQRAKIL